jgi:hypothetical protein
VSSIPPVDKDLLHSHYKNRHVHKNERSDIMSIQGTTFILFILLSSSYIVTAAKKKANNPNTAYAFSYIDLDSDTIATEHNVLHQARVDELFMSGFPNELQAKNGIT